MPLAGALYARETPVKPRGLGYLISPEGFDCFAQDEKNPRMGKGAVGRWSGSGYSDLPPRVCAVADNLLPVLAGAGAAFLRG